MTEWEIDVRRGSGQMSALLEPTAPGITTTLLCHGGNNAGALFRLDGGRAWRLMPFEQLHRGSAALLTATGGACPSTPDVYPVTHRIRTPGIYTCFNDTVHLPVTAVSRGHTVATQPVIFEVFDDGRAPREITDGSVSPPSVLWSRMSRRLYPNGSHSNASPTPNPHRYTFEPDRPQE